MAMDRLSHLGKIDLTDPSSQRERAEKQREKNLDPTSSVSVGPQKNAKVDEVAKMYEKLFLREMVKAMRQGTGEGYLKPSMAEKIFTEELDSQYVEAWGDRGGVGFSDIIYNEIMEKYMGGDPQAIDQLKAKGGLLLTDRDVANIQRVAGGRADQTPLKVELAPSQNSLQVQKAAQVQAPWSSQLVQKMQLPDGKSAVVLEHPKVGLRSTLLFDGVAKSHKIGDHLEAGESVGVLNPDVNSFNWNLGASQELKK